MEGNSNAKNPISDLVEVHEEPVAKWRNLQVCFSILNLFEGEGKYKTLFGF